MQRLLKGICIVLSIFLIIGNLSQIIFGDGTLMTWIELLMETVFLVICIKFDLFV